MSETTQKSELSRETIMQVLQEILKPEYAEAIFGTNVEEGTFAVEWKNCRNAKAEYEALLEPKRRVNHKTVTDLFKRLGMPANLLGFKFGRAAVLYADTNEIRAVTKDLYPVIAKEFDTTPSRVERTIRHAIEVVFDRGDVEVLEEIFGNTVDFRKGKPTNKEFIAMLVEYLNG